MTLEPESITAIVVTAIIALLLAGLIYCLTRPQQGKKEIDTSTKKKKKKDSTKQVQTAKSTSKTKDERESDLPKPEPTSEPTDKEKKDSGEPIPKKPENCGDLALRLRYLPSAERLTVVVLKARNLKCQDDDESNRPDPYISVSILHDGNILKEKKTATKQGTSDPTYNQAINFDIPLHVLPQVEIQFRIVNDAGAKTIGYLEIGPNSTGEELDHWKGLISNKSKVRCHKLK